jgi:hypothetical protein
MGIDFKKEIANLSHSLVQLERAEFFGHEDKNRWMPEYQKKDASVMCPPYVGPKYEKGGLIILCINPGGGTAKSGTRNEGDQILYPVITEFKNTTTNVEEMYWKTFIPIFREAKTKWDIYRQMHPVLEAAKFSTSQEELSDRICYFNFLQYRTKENKYPSKNGPDAKKIIPLTVKKFVKPLIKFLAPSLVVCFGKRVDEYIKHHYPIFPSRRVVWDRSHASKTPAAWEKVQRDREDCLKKIELWAESFHQECVD